MSVQGGGGGKKVPPSWAQRVQPANAQTNKVVEHKAAEQKKADAFEGRFKSTGDRLDEAFLHATSASGIENLVRVLEAARNQLAGESRTMREQAASIVERLVQAGFSPAQVALMRAELLELRKRMAALRKRLHHLQRRLKSAFAAAGKVGDAAYAKLLGAQLAKLRQMEPGMSRALLTLQTIEQAYGPFADGSTPVLRVHVGDQVSSEVGNAVVRLAPGAASSRALVGMVRDGFTAPPPSSDPEPAPPSLESMQALILALLPPKG
ncbi:MAG: hypothetical protein IT383_04055 [Deltaproteobacteria bacterium]|nr:hypothetical protein [Deltaproteobacteria bacterium]